MVHYKIIAQKLDVIAIKLLGKVAKDVCGILCGPSLKGGASSIKLYTQKSL